MGAADHLVRSGAGVSFLVLEASNWTGGRTHALSFGHESVGKVVVERGSNWVCGWGGSSAGARKHAPNVLENPVHALARRANLSLAYIPGSSQNMSNYAAVFDAEGKNADPDGALRRRANDAYDCLNATSWNSSISV
jgi:hypothetical protein